MVDQLVSREEGSHVWLGRKGKLEARRAIGHRLLAWIGTSHWVTLLR
jgi:hypothetical protein